MNSLFTSRTSAVIAGAATVALLTGGVSFASSDNAQGNSGNGSAPNGQPFQEAPAPPPSVGISHASEHGFVPAARNGLPGSIELVANCQQEGHVAVGGGYQAGGYKGGVTTYVNRNTTEPVGDPSYGKGWKVGFTNHNNTEQRVSAWVVCAEGHADEFTPPAG